MDDLSKTKTRARPQLEYWALDRLVPSPRNARTHSAAQVAEIAGSIRAFGFTNPILAGEDGDVIAGHGRLAAARSLGLSEVPVIPLTGLTETQRRQLVLADNRIARVIFCFHENELVVLSGFIKKSRRTPQGELNIARARKKELSR